MNKHIFKILGGLLALTIVAVGGWFWYGKLKELKGGDFGVTGVPQEELPVQKIFPETISESEQKNLDLTKIFTHPDLRFSFSYPEDFTASRLDSLEGGETIVVQNAKRNAGFQIHLEPYDDSDTDITAERLTRDIPEMKIGEARDVLIGAGGKGLAFIATDTGTREVWFIFGGTLFQLTAPLENDTLLQRVLGTWTFK